MGSFSGCGIGSLKGSASKGLDAIGQGVAKSELAAQWRAQHHGELVEFESEAFVGFQRGGRIAREHVPDLDQEFAGHGGDGTSVAFSGEVPLAQDGGGAHAQNGLSPLDEEMADVPTASFAHAEFDILAPPALALAGVESDVGHEFFGPLEAAHVANNGQQREGVDRPTPCGVWPTNTAAVNVSGWQSRAMIFPWKAVAGPGRSRPQASP